MKFYITLIALLVFNTIAIGQKQGDGNMTTITTSVTDLKSIDIQFNAALTLDYSLEETMSITIDQNIAQLVNITFENGALTLDQKEWINPSKLPTITIGSPNLTQVYQGTHSTTTIQNINTDKLRLEGNVGKIIASGTVNSLDVYSQGTNMDLKALSITNANINIDGYAKVTTDKIVNLQSDISDKGKLAMLSAPSNTNKSDVNDMKEITVPESNPNIKWIAFKIKNNSWRRNHFYVVGPKSDGSSFSYGFSMMPKSSRDEKWSVGTKIYKNKSFGTDELLVTITEADAGKTVDIFKD